MTSAKVTSKGQITIPKAVREALKLKPGTKVEFFETGPGRFELFAKTGSIRDLKGILPQLGYVPTIEEMNEAVLEAVAENFAVGLRSTDKQPDDEAA